MQLLSQLASQSANQLTNQQTNQPINRPTNQATNQPTNQPISRQTNHGADLANYSQNKRLRPPLPRKLHREEGRKEGIQKVALNSLKIEYV